MGWQWLSRREKKEEIPMTARIFAVADAYDSLTSRRRYRDSTTHEQAVKILANDRGKQFDPDVIDAFVSAQQAFLTIQSRYEAEKTCARRTG